jgi:hypothetical protein
MGIPKFKQFSTACLIAKTLPYTTALPHFFKGGLKISHFQWIINCGTGH